MFPDLPRHCNIGYRNHCLGKIHSETIESSSNMELEVVTDGPDDPQYLLYGMTLTRTRSFWKHGKSHDLS
jgi:hypothetical protein